MKGSLTVVRLELDTSDKDSERRMILLRRQGRPSNLAAIYCVLVKWLDLTTMQGPVSSLLTISGLRMTGANSKRPRKRNIKTVENSGEDCDEEDEGKSLSVPRGLNRSTQPHAQRQQMPTVTFLTSLSSHHQLWTVEEDEALCNLRNEGKNWEHNGERVLGRTAKGVKKRWEYLRTDSLKAAKIRTKECPRQQIFPVVLATSKIPRIARLPVLLKFARRAGETGRFETMFCRS